MRNVNLLAIEICRIYFTSLSKKKTMFRIDILGTSCEITRRWVPQNLTDDTWTLFQVMAWYRQTMLTQIYVAIWRH